MTPSSWHILAATPWTVGLELARTKEWKEARGQLGVLWASNVSVAQKVAFTDILHPSVSAHLTIYSPNTFNSQIQSFAPGDIIILLDQFSLAEVFPIGDYTDLQLFTQAGQSSAAASLLFQGNYSTSDFAVASSLEGHFTNLTVEPA